MKTVPANFSPTTGAAVIDRTGVDITGLVRVVSLHPTITSAADVAGDHCVITARGDHFIVRRATLVDAWRDGTPGVEDRDRGPMRAPRGRLLFFVAGPLRDRQGHLTAEEESSYG